MDDARLPERVWDVLRGRRQGILAGTLLGRDIMRSSATNVRDCFGNVHVRVKIFLGDAMVFANRYRPFDRRFGCE